MLLCYFFVSSHYSFSQSASFGNVFVHDGGEIAFHSNHTFVSGHIVTHKTENGGLVSFAEASSWSGAENTKHIDGKVRTYKNSSFTFPFGDNSQFAPLRISEPSSAGHFTAYYINEDPDLLYSRSMISDSIEEVSSCEYWMLDRTSGSSDVSVTLNWDDPRSCHFDELSTLLVAKWNGSEWISEGNASTTGNTGSGSITSQIVSSFSPFTIAQGKQEAPTELLIPDAFSPNGDGANDIFYVRGSNIIDIHLKIFNRWGELVFETHNQSVGWDGTFKGKPQEMDAYVFTLVAVNTNNEKLQRNGTILLLR